MTKFIAVLSTCLAFACIKPPAAKTPAKPVAQAAPQTPATARTPATPDDVSLFLILTRYIDIADRHRGMAGTFRSTIDSVRSMREPISCHGEHKTWRIASSALSHHLEETMVASAATGVTIAAHLLRRPAPPIEAVLTRYAGYVGQLERRLILAQAALNTFFACTSPAPSVDPAPSANSL